MLMPKIINYLSRLDGVKVGEVHDSHSHYFTVGESVIRVSDHLSIKFNCPQTLNVVVDTDHEVFVVFYGNKIIPVETYDKLKEALRNFVFFCDILAPLTDLRAETAKKLAEKMVAAQPSEHCTNFNLTGLTPNQVKGLNKIANQYRALNKRDGITTQ